jgi:4-diphosphocytidyl-2-C-methyl-D-erythritol kinase
VGDVIRIQDAPEDGFSISGPFARLLSQGEPRDNLVLQARDLLREAFGSNLRPVSIHLEKNLPISSGIGGGSADAAAALRGLLRHWNVARDAETLQTITVKLGADVPMCLASQPLIARGIGEHIDLLDDLPTLFMVLVNPLKGVSTPEIFRRLTEKNHPPLGERGDDSWFEFIQKSRNDLEPPARVVLPDISKVSDQLSRAGASLVRMSGSGATCFGLFATMAEAETAATRLRDQRQDWYVQATATITGPKT